MKTKIVCSLMLLFFIFSCADDDKTIEVKPVKFISLHQGDLHGNKKEGIVSSKLIIEDNKAFEVLIEKMNTINEVINAAPEVDFKQNIVLAVFDEVRSHGGYSIDITKVTEQNDRIVVEIQHLNKGGMLTVITQPYHIVQIPKTEKPITFTEK